MKASIYIYIYIYICTLLIWLSHAILATEGLKGALSDPQVPSCIEAQLLRSKWLYQDEIVRDADPWGKCPKARSARDPNHAQNYYCDGYRKATLNVTSRDCIFMDLNGSMAKFAKAKKTSTSTSTHLLKRADIDKGTDVDVIFVGDSLTNLIFDAANCLVDANNLWDKIHLEMVRDDFLVSNLPCHDNCINPAWRRSMERQRGYLQNHACTACQTDGTRKVVNETALLTEWNERIPLTTRIAVLGTGAHYHFHLHGHAQQDSDLFNQTINIVGSLFSRLSVQRPHLQTFFVDLPPSLPDTGKQEYEWDLYRVKNRWAHHILKQYPSIHVMRTQDILFPRKFAEYQHSTLVTNTDLLHWCSPGLDSVPLFIFRLIMHYATK